jgi:hypothetical protein
VTRLSFGRALHFAAHDDLALNIATLLVDQEPSRAKAHELPACSIRTAAERGRPPGSYSGGPLVPTAATVGGSSDASAIFSATGWACSKRHRQALTRPAATVDSREGIRHRARTRMAEWTGHLRTSTSWRA